MSKTGRPSILNEEMANAIIDLLKRGNYLATAAAYVGITPASITAWVRKGNTLSFEAEDRELDETEQLFVWFAVEVEKARAWAEIKSVEKIRQAANETWQAAAWYLERTNPRDWGRVSRTEITGADVGEIDASSVNRKIEALLSERAILPSVYNVIEAEVVEPDSTPELETPNTDDVMSKLDSLIEQAPARRKRLSD